VVDFSKYFGYDRWRPWQREIAGAVHEGLERGNVVLIEAPTGIGKTAAILAPALAFAKEEGLKVLYLVRTRNEALAPLREISRIKSRGVEVGVALFRNRLDMCCISYRRNIPYEEFIGECKYLRSAGQCSFYNNAVKSSVEVRELTDYLSFVRSCCKLGLCPYEVSRRMLVSSDISIMSYYYVFSDVPTDLDLDLRRSILIVDEAHSLPDSILSINSTSISTSTVRAAIRDVREIEAPGAVRVLKGLLKFLESASCTRRISVDEILNVLSDFDDVLEAEQRLLSMRRGRRGIPYTPLSRVVSFYRRLTSISKLGVFVEPREDGVRLTVRLLDPAYVSSRVFNAVHSAVLASGTLPRSDMLVSLLGINRRWEEFRIPFREYVGEGSYLVLVDRSVTTRFVERGEEMYERIAMKLMALFNSLREGAMLAVFPSYNVMKSVRKYMALRAGEYIVESGETNIEEVIERMRTSSRIIIMAVAGGKLVEGVEFKVNGFNPMKIVAVVGVPYPEPNDLTKAYVEVLRSRIGESAEDLVYKYQAVVKVKQAVGRLFRDPGDRGIIVLMDRRYLDPSLAEDLPDFLRTNRVLVTESLESEISSLVATFFP